MYLRDRKFKWKSDLLNIFLYFVFNIFLNFQFVMNKTLTWATLITTDKSTDFCFTLQLFSFIFNRNSIMSSLAIYYVLCLIYLQEPGLQPLLSTSDSQIGQAAAFSHTLAFWRLRGHDRMLSSRMLTRRRGAQSPVLMRVRHFTETSETLYHVYTNQPEPHKDIHTSKTPW